MLSEILERINAGTADVSEFEEVAQYYRDEGELSKAAEVYEKAVKRYPEDLALLYALGKTYEDLANQSRDKQWLDKAAQVYQDILKQDKTYQDVSLRFMMIQVQRGKADDLLKP